MRLGKTLKIAALTVLLIVLGLVATVIGVLMFAGAPMKNGSTLADGKVTLVVDWMGPVRIGAYLVNLADGGFALVDAGQDPEARALLAALKRRGAHAGNVRAVFFTHGHSDHTAGVRAFPHAERFALEPDAGKLRRAGIATTALADGGRITVAGTTVEAFAIPGHTAGSAAYLIEGVLFLGDAAGSVSDSRVAPNDVAYTADRELNHRSLRALAERLRTRREDVRYLAFGHQGPVKGFGPLFDWASSTSKEASP